MKEAICGFTANVPHLDGRNLSVRMPYANSDTVKVFPGEGMPNNKTRKKGDFKVTFLIKFPDLNNDERDQIGKILSRRF